MKNKLIIIIVCVVGLSNIYASNSWGNRRQANIQIKERFSDCSIPAYLKDSALCVRDLNEGFQHELFIKIEQLRNHIGTTGEFEILLEIDTKNTVSDVRILSHSFREKEYEKQIKDAIMKWVFYQKEISGKPVILYHKIKFMRKRSKIQINEKWYLVLLLPIVVTLVFSMIRSVGTD